MNTSTQLIRRRRRMRRLTVAGACVAAVVSTGLITTSASAATPDSQVGFEGCTGSYTAVSGDGTFTLPDVASNDDYDGDPGRDVEFGPPYTIDEQDMVPLSGVVDMSNVSVTCNAVNNEVLFDGNFGIRIGAASTGGVSCITESVNLETKEVGASGSDTFTASQDATQCDNATSITVIRQVVLTGIG